MTSLTLALPSSSDAGSLIAARRSAGLASRGERVLSFAAEIGFSDMQDGRNVLVYCAWRLSFDLEGFQHDVGQALFSDPKPMTLTPIAITGLIVIGLANAALAFGGLHAV